MNIKKKILVLLMVLSLSIGLIGCSSSPDDISITEGTILKEDNKTLATITIDVVTNLFSHYELYPGINSTLLDNLGNEYHVLDVSPKSNFSGTISEKGSYSGTLIFPRLEDDADYLRLRIDEVRHYAVDGNQYSNNLEGVYVITFNFRKDDIKQAMNKSKSNNKNNKSKIRVNNKSYSLESVTVSTENGDVLKEIKVDR